MQAITNQTALDLSKEVKKTVTPNEFVNETLDRKDELEQLRAYINKREKKKEAIAMEKMIITAFQTNAPSETIEAMRKQAGITEARLAELEKRAKLSQVG